jgi:hypothetical protein
MTPVKTVSIVGGSVVAIGAVIGLITFASAPHIPSETSKPKAHEMCIHGHITEGNAAIEHCRNSVRCANDDPSCRRGPDGGIL